VVPIAHQDAASAVARAQRRMAEGLGAASRRVQGRGPAGRLTSGLTRRVATRVVRGGVYTYRDPWGHLVEADLSDYMERAGFFGAHSPVLLRRLRQVVRRGDWVVDVGANVGLVTSALCAYVGPGGNVSAVEPLPANVAKLEALKAANGLDQLTVFPVALSSERATGRLRLPITGGSGWGSFVATWETAGEVEVPTCPLDELVAEARAPRPLRLVKLDAEGYEPQILRGATRTLSSDRPLVLCEFNDVLLHHAGTSSRQLLASFEELGYRPVPVGGRRRPPSMSGRTVDLLLAHPSGQAAW
jgi:FkbM family methyltransferase